MIKEAVIFQITSKLPGYLFVLTGITDIGDKVHLNCSSDCFCFTAAMLKEVGIWIDTSHILNRNSPYLFMMDASMQLEKLNKFLKRTNCSVIYIKESDACNNILENASTFVARYPHCIIVVDNAISPFKNKLSILMNSDSSFYSRIENHILRFGNG